MKTVVLLLIVLNISLFAQTITIAVAANVSYAMDELKAEFIKTHPDVKVRIALGSSGKLTAQIKNGAPYGLFMSANMKYPQALYKDKLATTKPVVYAQGALAFLSVRERDFSQGMNLLKDPSIKKIAVANPKTAPYGIAAKEALEKAGIYDAVKSKFVYGESISQTVSYAVTATEIGIIAKSSLYSSKMKRFKEGVNWSSVDTNLYTPIQQGIVLLKEQGDIKAYKEFYDFVLSRKAQAIFLKYGYTI
jgi:molybdate transport system substrate-binding protein